MNVTVITSGVREHECSTLVVGCCIEGLDTPELVSLDARLDGALGRLFEQREFVGKPGTSRLILSLGRLPAERVLLVGMGKRQELSIEALRRAAGTAAQALRSSRICSAASSLHSAFEHGPDAVEAEVTGYLLGNYLFDRYKSDKADLVGLDSLEIVSGSPGDAETFSQAAARGATIAEGVIFARDLVSEPGNVATPGYLAARALEIAELSGVTCQVLERPALEELGMGGLLAVAKGSVQGPRFIILEYRGAGAPARPVVMVGKGITFDSGGISLKPREGMEAMKTDMAGAAAVMATVRTAASLGLPCSLVGLIPSAENLPDGGAYKPGDVVTTMSGKTVEINNTDAEGRMLLCDALHYARRYKPAALIDLATLTGACVVALGAQAAALMGNDEKLRRALKKSSDRTGERLWELPLWDEYGEAMKSDIADLKNAGGPAAGSITAGWFLKQFVGDSPWAHLDIAGTAWEDKGRYYLPKGATGVGVRLLVEYLRERTG